MLVGKGDRSLLWENLWVGDRLLKDIYPRLCRIALDHLAKVQDCYVVEGGETRWEFSFRRNLRGFKQSSWEELKVVLRHSQSF